MYLTAQNAQMEAYQIAYVESGVSAGEASTTVGNYVIGKLNEKYGTDGNFKTGLATITATTTGNIEISTTDFVIEGEIADKGGNLTWGEIEANVPSIKIINIPSILAKDDETTLDIKRRNISNDAIISWSSDSTNIATIDENTGKLKGISTGNAIITASTTENRTTYTAQCTILVKEFATPAVGDFVNYDAGNWNGTNGKLLLAVEGNETIEANNSTDRPSQGFQFGGFIIGSSKNGNATPYNASYNYVKEKKEENGTIITTDVTGWRIFDITDNGIILISAGCPEDYCHPKSRGGNNGYISEYILTGNSDNIPSNISLPNTYKSRNWTADYVSLVNQNKGITANVLTKAKLENWYKKYVDDETSDLYYNTINYGETTGQTIFQKIYNTKYESLIDNYSNYWIASADLNNIGSLFKISPDDRYMDSYGYYAMSNGIRILINIPASVTLTETPIGEKVITSRYTDYTYKIWGIN